MLTILKQKLTTALTIESSAPEPGNERAPRFAAAALLLEAAYADSNCNESELMQIKHSLINKLAIHSNEIDEILELAQVQLDSATCLHEITTIINRNWTLKTKINLVESLWCVVLSDEHLSAHEQHLMRKVKSLLHIPQTEYIAAKIRAQETIRNNLID